MNQQCQFSIRKSKTRWTIKKAPLIPNLQQNPRFSTGTCTSIEKDSRLSTRSLSPDLKKHSKVLNPVIRKVFVMKAGAKLDRSLSGFFYYIQVYKDHVQEMIEFFKYCKNYFNSQVEFKYLMDESGRNLNCLHEIDDKIQVVIVSKNLRLSQSLCKSRKNGCFSERQISKLPNDSITRSSSPNKSVKSKKSFEKFQLLKNIKLGMSNLLKEIEKHYPNIDKANMRALQKQYKLSDIKILKLNAKFKTLILLSCSIDPNHNLRQGISKKAFIEYNHSNVEKAFVLEKIFNTFDHDEGGTISWHEFLKTASLIENGSNSQKIDLFFRVYDTNNDGKLSYKEVFDLCKVQLGDQHPDSMIEELANYSASLVFDIARLDYNQEIPINIIKFIIDEKNDSSLKEIFCSFKFLRL